MRDEYNKQFYKSPFPSGRLGWAICKNVIRNIARMALSGDFTNTIEGFWGTLKRMIEGIYHSISSKYIQRYIDEAVYRYNTRKMSGCDCFKSMFKASIGVVDYEMVKKVA